MLLSMRTALFGLALAVVATASDVTDLKKDTFNEFIESNDLVLAECKLHFTISVLRAHY